ncbi:phage regulatory protein/antirepressor Ant [Acinetobacter johnsonii]|uniref:Rha family transcriptional regulator n=1 Tax=Acinetobacter johnsonii TaxID=40214 RepID=UPI00244CEEB5|nr:phage antirepressor KilAC domain-containing protein [Acinetobacter johnsonii]MDH1276195.1 phage regulatory protein/antirepressor Ant [Acinetobacter johnsonii]
MNMPILPQFAEKQKTMGTRVIAELCEKEHRNVKRDCDVMFASLNLDALKFEHIYFDSMNRQQTEYLLDEELTMTLVTGYNIVLRNRVIKRWKELELQANLPSYAIDDPIKRAEKWIEEAKQKQAAIHQLELAAPKVKYFDKVVDRSTLLNATQVAQKLGMSAVAMNKLLDDLDVYSRNVKRARVFKQWFIDAGYGELKQTELGFSQPMFTTKGEAWAIEKLVSEGVA